MGPMPVDNGHSFILEERRGMALANMPEGLVHGINPALKWQVDTLRERKSKSDIELGSAKQLHAAAVIESHDAMHRLIDNWEYQADQAEQLGRSFQNAKEEFRSAKEASNSQQRLVENLRAETRELALKVYAAFALTSLSVSCHAIRYDKS